MSFSQEWLEDQYAIRGILVEIGVFDVIANAETTLYLSNMGYITTDSLTNYLPIISGGVQITESLTIDNSVTLSFGDLEINNTSGEYDSWLDNTKFIWVNRPITIYIGDPSWVCNNISQVRTDFYKVFSGVITDIDSKAREVLNIKIGDKLQRLNTPLSESKLGIYGTWPGTQANQDTIKPLVFGEIFNSTPLLIDPSQLEYMFNDGKSEELIEIRDNGVPVYNSLIPSGATVDMLQSKVKLQKPLVGTCTMSLRGKPLNVSFTTGVVSEAYTNTIANLVAILCTQYGNTATRLSVSDIDLANFNNFTIANPYPIGLVVSDRENVLNVCQTITSSIGAQIYMNRLGKLQLIQLGVPTSDTSVTITDNDIIHHSLNISARIPVRAANKLGYCKNWTVQSSLATNIPSEHKDSFAKEWYTNTIVDPEVKVSYSLNSDPIQKDTLLISRISADIEATRLTNYFSEPKTIYKFTGTSKLLNLKLGQSVVLQHSRFNLTLGKIGQVVTLSPNWATSTIEVEVII